MLREYYTTKPFARMDDELTPTSVYIVLLTLVGPSFAAGP